MEVTKGFITGGERILLNRYSAMGDVLEVFPFAKALKEACPEIHLTWFVATPWDELVRCQPYVDDVIVWNQKSRNVNFIKSILEVRKRKFDKLLCFQGTDRGALLSLLSGIPVRVGTHCWAKFAYTHNVRDVAKFLGLKNCKRPWVYVTKEAESKAKEIRSKVNGPLLFSIIGASKAVKRWPARRWVELSHRLKSLGWGLVLIGHGREEESMASEIVKNVRGVQIINLVSQLSLVETAALAKECDAALGGDTGFMHLVKLIGLPAVGLFGPTLPEQVGLAEIERALVSSCEKVGCGNWECPNQECLGSIKSNEVVDALEKVLKKP